MNISRHPREGGDPYHLTPGFPINTLWNNGLT